MQLPKIALSFLALACVTAAVAIPGTGLCARGARAARHLSSEPAAAGLVDRSEGDGVGAEKMKRYEGDDECE
ncbi:hypothetical protein QBC47DRAFT_406301 [Echria macrotheca]|uniref:Uncharacterized protein n=1 Tax=Echria macrotheca TaxID=438768 RepID=A0AAJ0B6F1_9PEZI|nr:hypothetical protein QBC47DRAFT_406301 [Echria macrotheca]